MPTNAPDGAAVIETARLLLRPLTMDDLDDLYRLYRDPEVRRYFPEGTLDRRQTAEELAWIIEEYYGRYGYGLWATIHKSSGDFVGRCGLLPWTIDGQFEVEVAYLLARTRWGRGLGTEAARGVRDHGFGQLRLPRLISLIDPENRASMRVAEKIGMSLEREIEDRYGRALLYAAANPAGGERERVHEATR